MPMSSYEFTQEQNTTIRGLAYFMRGVGTVYVVLGLAGLGGAAWILYNLPAFPAEATGSNGQSMPIQSIVMIQVAASSFFSILSCISGLMLRRASLNFNLVVQTQGEDIEHLMSALGNLNSSFGILYYILLFILLAYTASILLPLFLAFAR